MNTISSHVQAVRVGEAYGQLHLIIYQDNKGAVWVESTTTYFEEEEGKAPNERTKHNGLVKIAEGIE